MRVFWWPRVHVLAQYRPGHVLVIAEDRETAIAKASHEHRDWALANYTADDAEDMALSLATELASTAPEELTNGRVLLLWGSE